MYNDERRRVGTRKWKHGFAEKIALYSRQTLHSRRTKSLIFLRKVKVTSSVANLLQQNMKTNFIRAVKKY